MVPLTGASMADDITARVAQLYEDLRKNGRLLPVPDHSEWPTWERLEPKWQRVFLYCLEPEAAIMAAGGLDS